MKAIRVHEFGESDVMKLEEVPDLIAGQRGRCFIGQFSKLLVTAQSGRLPGSEIRDLSWSEAAKVSKLERLHLLHGQVIDLVVRKPLQASSPDAQPRNLIRRKRLSRGQRNPLKCSSTREAVNRDLAEELALHVRSQDLREQHERFIARKATKTGG